MNKQKGIAQIFVMVIMLVMAIALPITTKLVQQSQENRSKATSSEICINYDIPQYYVADTGYGCEMTNCAETCKDKVCFSTESQCLATLTCKDSAVLRDDVRYWHSTTTNKCVEVKASECEGCGLGGTKVCYEEEIGCSQANQSSTSLTSSSTSSTSSTSNTNLSTNSCVTECPSGQTNVNSTCPVGYVSDNSTCSILQKEINGCNYLECCSCKKASSCIPSCACSKDTLVGKTCSNGCGGFCDGIKTETPVESNNTNTESSSSTETPVESNNTNTESSSSDSVTKLAIRFAYAGIKPNNDSCATNIWPITSKISMSSNIIGDFGAGSDSLYLTEGIPKKTSSLNSKGEIVYEYGLDFSGEGDISDIYFSFFLKGPKHIFIKYGQNKQNKWYDSLVGKIKLVPGENAFDFSEYPIFAGDVTGEINEVPDGKLDGRDWSYIKEKANKLLVAAEAGTDVSGDINGDCQVNSGDVRLIKQMLSEVNGQTY